jgi:hypothetical protein
MFFVVRGNIAIPVVPRCKFPVDAHTQPRYKDTAGLSQMLPGAREFVVEGSVWDGDGIKKSRNRKEIDGSGRGEVGMLSEWGE